MMIDGQDILIKVCSILLLSLFLFFATWAFISFSSGSDDPSAPRTETIYLRKDGSAYLKECHEEKGGFYAGKVFVPTSKTECKEIEVEITTP